MKVTYLLLVVTIFTSVLSSAQSWQDCAPNGDFSFNQIKGAVHRVAATGGYTGWDEKTFNRSGDLVAVAVLQTVGDDEMASVKGARNVLTILRDAFACPDRCVQTVDERQPRVTMLLLEHLRELTHGSIDSEINDAKTFISNQAGKAT